MRKRSKFLEWFEAQFGKRPKSLDISEVIKLEIKARYERKMYERRLSWDFQMDTALKAWNAKS